ncbi:heavy metal translocating P-type ATPase [Acinetobacter sp. ANC 5414]|uniref:heavy metal translocating P-type ATPase n=1 Tax=Acinetobacter sp. ANC 5414 TaxID=2731251 RepID=UPI00148FBE52|nr:heavy metal translocating P-type ATPase [Acinetobacter sp. ANC 5414]NNH01079.1 heavy metal translocating P-type ATPase [Acinetobacter sp. ANC 5414]
MNEQQKSSCCAKQDSVLELVKVDPVCGMNVPESSEYYFEYLGKKYLFCCDSCKQKFIKNPEAYLQETKPKSGCGCANKAKVVAASSSCCGGQKAEAEQYSDPVCGMTVTDLSKPHTEYSGQLYYFCCQSCLNKFQANPEQYLEKEAAKTSGCGCASKSKADEKKSCCGSQNQPPVAQSSGCCAGNKAQTAEQVSETTIDPVCGMQVKTDSKFHAQFESQDYYFCSERCLNKFTQQPEQYVQTKQTASSCCASPEKVVVEEKTSSCCGGAHDSSLHGSEIDPVCGMSVDTSTDLKTDYLDKTYYFCNPSCLEKFKGDPEFYLIPADQRPVPEGAADMDYTCPMDPEIVQKGPGTCPICGMALEPMQPTLNDAPNPELVDFSHRFWMTLPLTLIVFVMAMGSHIHAFIPQHIQPWIELVLSIPVILWAGKPFIERCWISYKTRNLNMWSLIGVGVLAAFIYSVIATVFPSLIPMQAKTGHGVAVYYEAACMIVSLSLLGQIMELKARAKTADALKSLLKLQPHTAKLVQHDQVVEVDIGMVKQGDILQISSGDQIPLDGIVVEGKTYVDEAMMTGEPVPVKKEVDDRVIGGTVNQQGSIRIQTTAVGANTTLAKMIQTVAEAQRSKAPLQRLADVFAKYFVVIVLAISVLTFIAWMVFGKAQFDLALMCAVAVLIIACPCALGLATPMSVMATTGRAAQKGVLFKDAEAIEALSKVTTLIVDKTGTLTEGKPSLKEIKLLSEHVQQAQVEQWIASIEQYSTHPIAQTLTKLVPHEQLIKVNDFEDVAGFGVKGQIDDQTLYVGSQKLIDQLGLQLAKQAQEKLDAQRATGNVISFLANEQHVLAYISIHDAIKPNAHQVIDQLIADGIEVVMATGDHEKNAKLIAAELGIQHVYGNCTPTEKLDIVKKYQAQGKVVAMAGDGINDAPALAQANVGIAMGNGTDIAKQTAQVTLVKGDIRGVADAIHMAKLGVKNMKQNLAFSFVYNGLGVPVAAGIFYPLTGLLLTPMFAAVAMSLSSLSVVINALRLQKSR